MLTFSQLVDEVAMQTGRVDKTSQIALQCNQTVREVHSTNRGKSIFYPRNMIEDQITATLIEAQTFTVPNFFQHMRTVRYDSVIDRDGNKIYPKMLRPGRVIKDQDYFYYRAGQNFYFVGYGGINALISLAYYVFPSLLKYRAVGSRPAEYDFEDGWTYFDLTAAGEINYDLDAATQLIARTLVTNWAIFDWFTTIVEGTKGKAFKATGDEDRARTHFAQYTISREALITGENGESLDM